ncbi:MAG TPA: MFS transporter [Bacillota bacterium]|nr:MFS transporter [Bacillota bacterium]
MKLFEKIEQKGAGAMLKRKLGYACGDIYGGGAFLIFSMLYMNFLVIVEGLPVFYATLIIFVGKLWDAITDPIVGNLSDKTRSKYGRRRIYFLIGIIPVLASFIMMWYSFGISGETARFIYHMLAYMFFGTAFTIVMVPYNAILPEMTSDYNERTSFTAMRMAFSAGTSILAAVIPSIIIKSIGGDINGPEQIYGYLAMAVLFGLIFAACWFLTFLGTFERKEVPAVESFSMRKWLSVFQNRTYRIFLGIFITVQVAIDLLLALFVFYVDIVVLQYKNYEVIMGVLLVFQLLFMLLHNRIAQYKGKHYPLYIGLPVWIAASFAFIFITSETPLFVLCILAVLIALGASAGNLATWSMLSDIYDVDELMTSKRREGIYSGITTFIRKFSSGIAVLLLGLGLSLAGFNQNEYNISRSMGAAFNPGEYATTGVALTIKWMFVVIPVVFLAAALIFALRYKLDCKRFNSVIQGIEKLKSGLNPVDFSSDEKATYELLTGKAAESLWDSRIAG